MSGFRDVFVGGSQAILHEFQRELSDRVCMFDCHASAVLAYQRLEPFELAAPDRFDVAVPARIPRFGRIAERNRSDLQKIRLGPAGEFDTVTRVGRLTKDHSSAI